MGRIVGAPVLRHTPPAEGQTWWAHRRTDATETREVVRTIGQGADACVQYRLPDGSTRVQKILSWRDWICRYRASQLKPVAHESAAGRNTSEDQAVRVERAPYVRGVGMFRCHVPAPRIIVAIARRLRRALGVIRTPDGVRTSQPVPAPRGVGTPQGSSPCRSVETGSSDPEPERSTAWVKPRSWRTSHSGGLDRAARQARPPPVSGSDGSRTGMASNSPGMRLRVRPGWTCGPPYREPFSSCRVLPWTSRRGSRSHYRPATRVRFEVEAAWRGVTGSPSRTASGRSTRTTGVRWSFS